MVEPSTRKPMIHEKEVELFADHPGWFPALLRWCNDGPFMSVMSDGTSYVVKTDEVAIVFPYGFWVRPRRDLNLYTQETIDD